MVLYIMKYFAAQVQTLKEDSFVSMLNSTLLFRQDLQRFFFLKRCLPIRKAGKLIKEFKPIFPGYVFIEAEDIDSELYNIMRSTKFFLRFLPSNNNICTIEHKDLALLQHFIRMGSIAEISTVTFDENDRIVVKSGPMSGLEGFIVKVDKRKKRAKIALDFSHEQFLIDLAFDVLEETQNEQK